MELNNESFFKLFRKLESLLNVKDDSKIMDAFDEAIKKDIRLKKFRNKLFMLKSLRNIEAHTDNAQDYITIDKKTFIMINEINNILQNPLTAYDVSSKEITFKTLKDNVLDSVNLMRKNKFSYLPIFEDNKFFGVFSAEVLFNFFYETGETYLDKTIEFQHLKSYLPITKHINENFSFKSRKFPVTEIQKEFMDSYNKNKLLSAVFVTENGKKEEKIIGIITAWDVLNAD